MALESYKTIDEKTDVFASHTVVNTSEELLQCLDNLKTKESHKKERFLFRGHNEAKFKLYTSAQRFWDVRNLGSMGLNYTDSINRMIESIKDPKNALNNYLKRLDVIQNDWMILSFLQHYGAITPLLDFSRKYLVALFFAFDKVSFSNEKTIDNYVSIYYYKTVDAANSVSISITSLAERSAKKKKVWQGKELWNDLTYKKIMTNHQTVILPAYSNCSKIQNEVGKQITTYTIANLNATAQEGEFVCNGEVREPLENLWKKNGKKYLHCIDIHKGLYDFVLTKIMQCTIEEARKRYYLDEKDLAHNAQLAMLSSL